MKRLFVFLVVLCYALSLTACNTGNTPVSSATSSPLESSAPSKTVEKPAQTASLPQWEPLADQNLVGFSKMEIPAELQTIEGVRLDESLHSLDALIHTAASFITADVVYRGDFSDEKDLGFAWQLITQMVTHYDDAGEITLIERGVVPAYIIKEYFSAYFYNAPDDIPPIPESMDRDYVSRDSDDAYSFILGDGIMPDVVITQISSEKNDRGDTVIALYADVQYTFDDFDDSILPVYIELGYTGKAPAGFGLSRVMVAADGENNADTDEIAAESDADPDFYSNETYDYAVRIPAGFKMMDSDEEGAVFQAEDGASLTMSGDWADIGGDKALSGGFERDKGAYDGLIDSFYEPELGYGVFFHPADNENVTCLYGVQWGRAVVFVEFTYPRSQNEEYLPIAEKLSIELTALEIPSTILEKLK